MNNVIVYSKNHYMNIGLDFLVSRHIQLNGMTVKQCQSYLTALRLAKKSRFIFFDESDGASQAKRQVYLIKKINPEIKVFSLATGKEYSFESLGKGYINKRSQFKYSPLPNIINTIQNIKYSTPAADRSIDYSDKTQFDGNILPRLTERESLILNLILKGKCNARIAHLLDIAPKTTSSHRRSLFRKMNVRSIAELVDYMH